MSQSASSAILAASPADAAADLSACAREPIHNPGLIQPHGCLFVLSVDGFRILQAAVPPRFPAIAEGSTIGRALADVLPAGSGDILAKLALLSPGDGQTHIGSIRTADDSEVLQAIAHWSGETIILELERSEAEDPASFEQVHPFLQAFLSKLQAARTVEELGSLAAGEVRRITGFDRVLVYQFDAQWHGTVIAEDGNDRLPSYRGQRFPASDIPAQARDLYRRNRLRLIADADYVPVPILPPLHPSTGTPVDLSQAVLRSVAPVHVEYMRNMRTGSSMSISLVRDGELWGLISCHSADPHRIAYPVRSACDFLGQILSLQIAAKEQAALADRRIALRSVQTELLASMSAATRFADGLVEDEAALLGLTHARGAAIILGDEQLCVGAVPPDPAIAEIVGWLAARQVGEIFHTDRLSDLMDGAEAWKDAASGLLAISISQIHDSYVLWFRPEVIQTVTWAGSPLKPNEVPEGARIHPRQSFEAWKEIVQLHSTPWDESETEAAVHLRKAIVEIVLRKAEEMAALNEQLTQSNKELEAFSYSVSHDLRAPFRHIVGFSELLIDHETLTERGKRYVDTIIDSAVSAGTLVDDLLSFSQMARVTLQRAELDLNGLVADVIDRLRPDVKKRAIDWQVGRLPRAYADPGMLRLVFQNLLDNAVKFTRGVADARIEVGHRIKEGETVYFVRDNGAGFDMAFVDKLFGVFQRLHRTEDYEGTGIGLANIKRIIEQRHGGRIWAKAAVGEGAMFSFTLPDRG